MRWNKKNMKGSEMKRIQYIAKPEREKSKKHEETAGKRFFPPYGGRE